MNLKNPYQSIEINQNQLLIDRDGLMMKNEWVSREDKIPSIDAEFSRIQNSVSPYYLTRNLDFFALIFVKEDHPQL